MLDIDDTPPQPKAVGGGGEADVEVREDAAVGSVLLGIAIDDPDSGRVHCKLQHPQQLDTSTPFRLRTVGIKFVLIQGLSINMYG